MKPRWLFDAVGQEFNRASCTVVRHRNEKIKKKWTLCFKNRPAGVIWSGYVPTCAFWVMTECFHFRQFPRDRIVWEGALMNTAHRVLFRSYCLPCGSFWELTELRPQKSPNFKDWGLLHCMKLGLSLSWLRRRLSSSKSLWTDFLLLVTFGDQIRLGKEA